MLYVILAEDAPDSLPRRRSARPRHLEYLGVLQREGRLLLGGAFPTVDAADLSPGVVGSMIVAEFASLDDARTWAAADPYALEGVFAKVDIRPFVKALPA